MELLEYLDFKDLFFINLCDIIGGGIFVLFTFILSFGGKNTIYAFILITLSFLISGMAYAEIVSIFKNNSSEYNLISNVINDKYAQLFSILIILFGIFTTATIIISCSKYVFNDNYIYNLSFSIILACSIFLLNFYGIEISSIILNIIGIIIILLLIFIIIYGHINLNKFKKKSFNNSKTKPLNFFICSIFIVFLFAGSDNITKMYNEIKSDTKKYIPYIIISSIIFSSIIYILLANLMINVFDEKMLKNEYNPISLLYKIFLGNNAYFISFFAGLIILLGSAFAVSLASTRYTYGLSKNNVLPNYLQKLSSYNTPYFIIIIHLVIVLLITITNNQNAALDLTNIITFIILLHINICLIIYRYNNKKNDKSYKMPLYYKSIPILPVFNSIFLFILLIISIFILPDFLKNK